LIASTLAQCKNLPVDEQSDVTIATSAHINRKNNVKSSSSSDPEDVSTVNIVITAAKPRQEDNLHPSGTGSGIRPMHKATPYHASQQQSSADSVIVDVPLAVAASKAESTRTSNLNQNIRYAGRQHGEAEIFYQAEAEKHRLEASRLTKMALQRRGVDGTVGTMIMDAEGHLRFEMRVSQVHQ
jgi:FtsZ-interacting cell division protein ZipA